MYNVCAMIVTFVRLGVIFFTSLRQKSHIKIKAKCNKYFVKVSPMTRVPQVEYLCVYVYSYIYPLGSSCYTSILTLILLMCISANFDAYYRVTHTVPCCY